MPYVTDTHALIWHMAADPRLSPKARRIFRQTDDLHEQVVIPCIVFFELLYLFEKGRIHGDFDSFVSLISTAANYKVEPMCTPIIKKARSVPRQAVPDPWDRLIVATSLHPGLPLITRDESLANAKLAGLRTVWQ